MRLLRRKKTNLNVYREHSAKCPHKDQGRNYIKCGCPLWVQGTHNGEPIRQSLGTRSMQEALRQVALLEDPRTPLLKPISEAVDAYKKHVAVLEEGTQRRYANTLTSVGEYCERAGLKYMADVTAEDLDDFRAVRTRLAATTAGKELTILRQFFGFCQERRWIEDNPAKKIKPPRNIKPKEVVPYEPNEITRIVAACEVIGHSIYERRRAKAMILLMRYTGLRISDVVTLAKDRIKNGQIFLHTKKTGGLVFLPIPKPLENALAAVPTPRGADENSRYYFWNGDSLRHVAVNMAERSLTSVFKRSGVKGARPHRFRHTLATEILAQGYTEQDVADILGISAAVVHKHYAKWSQARQDRINNVFRAVHSEVFGVDAGAVELNAEKAASAKKAVRIN